MKKRKELDALLGSRAKRDSSGLCHVQEDQDFLSSLSSPEADTYVAPMTNYGMASKRINRSSGGVCSCTVRRMIRICLPACFLSLVAACITACIGIVWMQVQLKSDVDRLKDRIVKLETWHQVQPDSIDDLKVAVTNMEKDLKEVRDGENGVRDITKQISDISKKVDDDHTLPRQSLELLRNEVEEFKKSIIELKSAIEGVKSTAETAHSSQQLLAVALDRLEKDITSHKENIDSTINIKQLTDISIQAEIKQLNSTFEKVTSSLDGIQSKLDQLQQKVPTDDYKKNQENVLGHMRENIELLKQDAQSKNKSISILLRKMAEFSSRSESKPAIPVEQNGDDHDIKVSKESDLEKQLIGSGKPHSKKARSVRTSTPNINRHDSVEEKSVAKHKTSPIINLSTKNNNPVNLQSNSNELLPSDRKSGKIRTEDDLLTVLQRKLLKSERDKHEPLSKEEIEVEFGDKAWILLQKLDKNYDGELNISEMSTNVHVSSNKNT